MKILTILALHTNNKQKINTTMINLFHLNKLSAKMLIIGSKECRSSGLENKLKIYNNIDYYYINNTNLIDLEKWIHGLNNINYNDFDKIILMNDSILFINNLDLLFNFIKLDYELLGISNSNEHSLHIQSYFRVFTNRSIKKLIVYFNENKDNFILNGFEAHKNHANYSLKNLKKDILSDCNNITNIKKYCKKYSDFIQSDTISKILKCNSSENEVNSICNDCYKKYIERTSFVAVFEINITNIFKNQQSLYDIDIIKNANQKNITLDNDIVKNLLINNFPVLKLKKINENKDYVNKFLEKNNLTFIKNI